MSYILEAIRRSEEAHHKRLIPDVATVHAVRPAAGRPGSRRLYVMIGVAVVLAVAAALRWWAWQAREEDPAVAASPAVSVPAPLADRAADPPAAAAAGAGDTSPALAPAPAAPAPRPENVPAQATSEPPAGPGAASTPRRRGICRGQAPAPTILVFPVRLWRGGKAAARAAPGDCRAGPHDRHRRRWAGRR